jgi:hypothetical protein
MAVSVELKIPFLFRKPEGRTVPAEQEDKSCFCFVGERAQLYPGTGMNGNYTGVMDQFFFMGQFIIDNRIVSDLELPATGFRISGPAMNRSLHFSRKGRRPNHAKAQDGNQSLPPDAINRDGKRF